MSVQVENLEKNMAKLTIEVAAEELEKALQEAYNRQKKNISMPGFRKGKVPRAMVEKMYGPAVFYEDAVNSLVPEEYSKAAEESKLDIVSRPEINVEQIEKGKAFIFTATVAVKPEVTLGEYKGLEVAKADTTVTDEEVEAATYAHGSKDMPERDMVADIKAASEMMERGITGIDVVKALKSKGFDDVASDLLKLMKLRVAGDHLHTSAILDKDFNVISAVNDKNDYSGPGTGYQISPERWTELSNIGNAVDASKIK